MTHAKTRVELSPETVKCLVRAEAYRRERANLWPTRDSWRHFIRSRRGELEQRGLLFELTAGFHVNADALDAALPELLTLA